MAQALYHLAASASGEKQYQAQRWREFGGNVFLTEIFTACQPCRGIQKSASLSIRLWFFFFFFETSVALRSVRVISIIASFLPDSHQFTWSDSVYCVGSVHYGSNVIFLDVTHPLCFCLLLQQNDSLRRKTKIFFFFLIKTQHCKTVFKGNSSFMSCANCQTVEYIPFLFQYFVPSWGNCLLGTTLYFPLDPAA